MYLVSVSVLVVRAKDAMLKESFVSSQGVIVSSRYPTTIYPGDHNGDRPLLRII